MLQSNAVVPLLLFFTAAPDSLFALPCLLLRPQLYMVAGKACACSTAQRPPPSIWLSASVSDSVQLAHGC